VPVILISILLTPKGGSQNRNLESVLENQRTDSESWNRRANTRSLIQRSEATRLRFTKSSSAAPVGRLRSAPMSDQTTSTGVPPKSPNPARERRLAFEVPEVAAGAILVAFFAIVVGGLVTGIIASTTPQAPLDQLQNAWNAVQFGTSWAEPLLAVALLGVIGLCWWQTQGWSEVLDTETDDDQLSEAVGHLQRARQIALWGLGSLAVIDIGAVVGLVAVIAFNVSSHSDRLVWARVVGTCADVVAVLVISAGGFVAVTRLLRHYSPPTRITGQSDD